jgi:hypothetical protein
MVFAFQNYKGKVVQRFFRIIFSALIMLMALVIGGLIDVTLSKVKLPPLGGLVAGMLLGLFFKDRELLYSALCGILYIFFLFIVLLAIGLGGNSTIQETLNMLFTSMKAVDFLKPILIMASFILGGYVGRILRNKM